MAFQPGANIYGVAVGTRPESVEVPFIADRAPTSSDILYPLGKRWIWKGHNEYVLISFNTFAGAITANWVVSTNTNLFPITPYVVGPIGQAGYQTIQAAIDAAHAAGGGTVWIQQGQYTENLILYDQVYFMAVCGISQGINEGVQIFGTHTPPLAGHVEFNGIFFASPTAIFSSNAAGSTHIQTANCETAVQNGFVFNLPNWTGIIEIYDCNPGPPAAPFAINDGGVNNSGGSPIIVYNSGCGNGTNTMVCSGDSFFGQAVTVGCPLSLITGANVTSVGSQYNGTVTFSNNAVMFSYNDSFVPGTTQAITYNSNGNSIIANAVVQTPNNPAIGGAGVGTLTLGGITFVGNSVVAGTLTIAYGASLLGPISTSGNLTFLTSGNKIISTSIGTGLAAGANSFGTVPLTGGVAIVATTAVNANSLIMLSTQVLGTVVTPQSIAVTARVASTSFTITSADNTDTSTIAWQIIN